MATLLNRIQGSQEREREGREREGREREERGGESGCGNETADVLTTF